MAKRGVYKSYPQTKFRKLLERKTELRVANDNTDMLIYLIYMDYLKQLLENTNSNTITERDIDGAHESLMRKYRG